MTPPDLITFAARTRASALSLTIIGLLLKGILRGGCEIYLILTP
jgi:hypothetical protein